MKIKVIVDTVVGSYTGDQTDLTEQDFNNICNLCEDFKSMKSLKMVCNGGEVFISPDKIVSIKIVVIEE